MWWLACTPASVPLEHGELVLEEPEDTGTIEVPETTEAPAPFGLEVHEIAITLDDQAVESLWASPYTYIEAELAFDGVEYAVALRSKGRYGSYRDLSQKAGFKVDVNRFVDQDIHGVQSMNINNMVQDGAQVHDFMAYTVYRAMGVPCPWVGYAWVTVNGETYGLYALVEDYDDEFVKDRFEDGSGNLYDGDYWLAEDWSTYVLLDFFESRHELFDLDSGTDVGFADIAAVTAVLDEYGATQELDEHLDEVVVMDEVLAMWAAETWLGHYDGYNYNSNNYRLYFDPSDGRMWMMPWDQDWSFYADTPIHSPLGRISSTCFGDTSCRRAYEAKLDEVCAIDAEMLHETLDEVTDLVNPYVRDDPRREVSWSEVRWYQDDVDDWIDRRCGELDR